MSNDINTGTIVWEVQNEMFVGWQMYTAEFCHNLEKQYAKYETNPLQYRYASITQNRVFDMKYMVEIDRTTGKEYPIHRLRLSKDCALAQKIIWEWKSDLTTDDWKPYPADVINYLHECSMKSLPTIDLSLNFGKYDLDYTIDFQKLEQINNQTGHRRDIRKTKLEYPYPKTLKKIIIKSLDEPSTSKATIKSTSKITTKSNGLTDVPHVLKQFAQAVTDIPNEDCSICMGKLNEESDYKEKGPPMCEVLELVDCKHKFHTQCIMAAFNNDPSNGVMCPYCKTIYGTKTGFQPHGQMSDRVIPHHLPGFHCDTIKITYDIRSGIQGKEHPNPGSQYHAVGFPREAYLPNNKDGKKVLKLLKVAWARRLIFTIGQSVTSGRTNAVTWNEIHHKTNMYSGAHGFPDPGFFPNVIDELKAQGVTEADI